MIDVWEEYSPEAQLRRLAFKITEGNRLGVNPWTRVERVILGRNTSTIEQFIINQLRFASAFPEKAMYNS
jgi:hypothetical protein